MAVKHHRLIPMLLVAALLPASGCGLLGIVEPLWDHDNVAVRSSSLGVTVATAVPGGVALAGGGLVTSLPLLAAGTDLDDIYPAVEVLFLVGCVPGVLAGTVAGAATWLVTEPPRQLWLALFEAEPACLPEPEVWEAELPPAVETPEPAAQQEVRPQAAAPEITPNDVAPGRPSGLRQRQPPAPALAGD